MKQIVVLVVLAGLLVGSLVFAAWSMNTCTSRGGRIVTVVPGKVYECKGKR